MRVSKLAQMKRLQAKLDQLLAAKRDANEHLDNAAFDAACDEIRDVEFQIWDLQRPVFKGCSISRELAAANVD